MAERYTEDSPPQHEQLIKLSKLPKGARGFIRLHQENEFHRTLLEMGLLPGEIVSVEVIAPFGDPMALMVSGYLLSIRKSDADFIWVEVTD